VAASATAAQEKPANGALKPRISKDAVARAKQFNGKSVASALNALRNDLRVTDEEIEKAIGISAKRLGEIEKDASQVTLEELHRLAMAFEYSVGGLVNRVTKKK